MTTPAFKRPKLTTTQVGAAGEHFVAAEIHRRGGHAVTFAGNMRDIDLLASDANHNRVIKIQVKTKTAAGWQATTTRGKARTKPETEDSYWVLVDLAKNYPDFYVVPLWWMQNDIHTAHSKYLADSGGHRVKNDDSTHHAIPLARIAQWKNRWDVLGILPTE
ncbi:hypothetical protein [Mycolicibacterium fortuitum]|uniref:hypothetical protein n=1 Tax=Mycolicibacterium fortuitum TaxID=1766 RepID=UPI0007EAAFF4|nr:hypothetical protein [Mycolicibacterium fortuitum]OBG45679.1 hypothetical protein A5670_07615 [Mycolicibacterium fortuitum]